MSRKYPFRNRKFRTHVAERLDERVVFSNTYFIDRVRGNDQNNGLDAEHALQTPSRLVSQYQSLKPSGHIDLVPGDTIFLMPGVTNFAYRYGEREWQGLFLRGVHGTSEQPITIRGQNGAMIKNLAPDGSEMNSINILDSSHIILENLDVTSYGSAIAVAASNNVIVRDNYIHDVGGEAHNNLSTLYLTGVEDVTVENNLFTDNYDRSKPGNANNRHVFLFGSSDVQIIGNTIFNSNPQVGMDDQIQIVIDDPVNPAALPNDCVTAVQAGKIWTNPQNRSDVNGDGFVTPLDALMIISALADDPTDLPLYPQEDSRFWAMVDTNGDQRLSELDALLVIAELLGEREVRS